MLIFSFFENTMNLQQNSLILPGVRNQQQNRLDYRKHFLGGRGIYINAYENYLKIQTKKSREISVRYSRMFFKGGLITQPFKFFQLQEKNSNHFFKLGSTINYVSQKGGGHVGFICEAYKIGTNGILFCHDYLFQSF